MPWKILQSRKESDAVTSEAGSSKATKHLPGSLSPHPSLCGQSLVPGHHAVRKARPHGGAAGLWLTAPTQSQPQPPDSEVLSEPSGGCAPA